MVLMLEALLEADTRADAQARDGEGDSTPGDILSMVKQQAAPGHRRAGRGCLTSHAPVALLGCRMLQKNNSVFLHVPCCRARRQCMW